MNSKVEKTHSWAGPSRVSANCNPNKVDRAKVWKQGKLSRWSRISSSFCLGFKKFLRRKISCFMEDLFFYNFWVVIDTTPYFSSASANLPSLEPGLWRTNAIYSPNLLIAHKNVERISETTHWIHILPLCTLLSPSLLKRFEFSDFSLYWLQFLPILQHEQQLGIFLLPWSSKGHLEKAEERGKSLWVDAITKGFERHS